MGRKAGIISLICGLISIPFVGVSVALSMAFTAFSIGLNGGGTIGTLISILLWLIPGIAIVSGIIGIFVDDSKGMAIAGLILGIVALIIGVTILTLFAELLSFGTIS